MHELLVDRARRAEGIEAAGVEIARERGQGFQHPVRMHGAAAECDHRQAGWRAPVGAERTAAAGILELQAQASVGFGAQALKPPETAQLPTATVHCAREPVHPVDGRHAGTPST